MQVIEVITPEWEEGCNPTVKKIVKKVKRKGQSTQTVTRDPNTNRARTWYDGR